MQQMGQGRFPGMGGMPGMPGMGGAPAGNRLPQPGWRGYATGSNSKKKKDKKKKGFGNL
jgi:signal recognition particle subunit SRP54